MDQIDPGSGFGAHRINEYGLWDNEFKRKNKKLGINEYLQYKTSSDKQENWEMLQYIQDVQRRIWNLWRIH